MSSFGLHCIENTRLFITVSSLDIAQVLNMMPSRISLKFSRNSYVDLPDHIHLESASMYIFVCGYGRITDILKDLHLTLECSLLQSMAK